MKPEHQLFIHHYILTGDKYAAYKAAYPHAEGQALQAAARRLINKPHISQYLEVQLFAVRNEATSQQHPQLLQQDERATLLLKRKALHDMISGEYKTRKYYKMRDHLEEVEEQLSPFAVIRAIELDTKLANEWYDRKANPAPASKPVVKEVAAQQPTKVIPLPPAAHEEWCEKQYGPDFMPALRAQMVRDNPRKAEEYKQQGLRVLDYCPSPEEIHRMMGIVPPTLRSGTHPEP